MEDMKQAIQAAFDELTEREGIPPIRLDDDDGAALPFGEGMLLRIQFRAARRDLVLVSPVGEVPEAQRTEVFAALLAANMYWDESNGATLAWHPELEQVILEYRLDATTLTFENLKLSLEGFIKAATEWRDRVADMISLDATPDDAPDKEDAGAIIIP